MDLQLYAVYARLGATPCSNNAPGSGGSNGWAIQMELNDTNSLGSVEIANYSTPTTITSSSQCGGVTGYTVTVPVDNGVQYQHVDFRIVVNKTGTLVPLLVSGSSTVASLSLDMFSQGATGSTTCSASGQTEIVLQSSDGNSVCLEWRPVSVGGKAPTWLFVPTSNGTLSSNPWGLKRYIGEQSFDVLVVNDSSGQPINSMNIPNQWGGSYVITLQPGVNNFLVPRTQFLFSALGQGVVLGSNLTDLNLSRTPPVLGTNDLNAIHFGGMNPLQNLSCYWQNLSINDNYNHTALCSGELGSIKGKPTALRVVGDAGGCSATNCGGIPSDPAAENANQTAEGSALQTVLVLNISTPTGLDLLVAGLLDNASAGVNGTFQLVTGQLSSLGLSKPVLSGLANAVITSNGLYASPTSVVPPPPPPSSGLWGALWNAVSGFTSWVVNGITILASLVWNAVVAITNFVNRISQGLQSIAEVVIGATVAALKAAGMALLKAAQWVATFIRNELANLLNAALGAFKTLASAFGTNVATALHQASIDQGLTGSITSADGNGIASAIGGAYFQIGVGVATAIIVGFGILSALSIGSSTLILLVIAAIIGAVLAVALPALIGTWGAHLFYAFENWVNATDSPGLGPVGGQAAAASKPCSASGSPLTSVPCDPRQLDWGTWVSWVTWIGTGAGVGYAAWEVHAAASESSFGWYMAEVLAFTFAVMGAVLTGLSISGICDVALNNSALFFAGVSFIMDLVILPHDFGTGAAAPWEKVLDIVTMALDGAVIYASL